MSRLVVVSNRVLDLGKAARAGGVAVTLADIVRTRKALWFGWNGESSQPLATKLRGVKACDDAGITVTLPKPMTSVVPNRQAALASRTSCISPRRMHLGCPAGEKLIYRYTNEENGQRLHRAIGRMPVARVRSKRNARRGTSGVSRAGSMKLSSKLFRNGSTRTPTRCARDARRSSILSARSRCTWARRTSCARRCPKSPPKWRSAC